MTINKKVKALVLLSGGLDSMLAAKVLLELGIEVTGISFESNFYKAGKARKAAEQLGIDLKVIDISDEILALVKNPPSGHGKNMNPCLDCHALMMEKANEILTKDGYNLIATGEVLGQRPFSQNKDALNRVMKLAGVEVLRPLSARLLPETEIEKKGLADRNKLLDFSGRQRDRQIELAKKFGIEEYPSPAGGCLLTDPAFSQRLKTMIENWPDCGQDDVDLLKVGRIFWLTFKNNGTNNKVLAVVGRNEGENVALEKLAKKGDFMVELKGMPGPMTLVRILDFRFRIFDSLKNLKIIIPECLDIKRLELENIKELDEVFRIAAILTGYYATKAREREVGFEIKIKS